MSIATYEGTVKNGQIKLSIEVKLPENATVYVVIPEADSLTKPKFDLEKMAAAMPADYKPHEEDFGTPVGKEVW